MVKNPLQRIAADLGCDIYAGAGVYSVSAGTLARNIRSIVVREDQAAMITALSLDINGTATASTLNIVGADLLSGDILTFEYPIASITLAGGSFIGYRG